MKNFIELQKKIAPEISDMIEKRYSILLTIKYNQPIGRRNISSFMGQTERWVRSELDVLKNQNLIEIQSAGMHITEEGEEIISKLSAYIGEVKGLSMLSKNLKTMLGVKEVLIVPGNCEKRPEVLNEMGRRAFDYMKECIKDNSVIAVSGGYSTMAMAENARAVGNKKTIVIPATGGHSGNLETQSNAVAERLAHKIDGDYYPLYLPESINDEMLHTMLADSHISKVVDLIGQADIFLFGLSTIEQIAERRKLDEDTKKYLEGKGAIAEAFGYYFGEDGEVILKKGSIGIRIEDCGNINTVISIAGGITKAKAIVCVNRGKNKNILVIDEKAAEEIYDIMRGE
ncbi:sugar-binding transcriptional regulator [Lutispora saccharofermentans]|uniref:Sugar-binding transcriptional regulator n=1 Tax=Lutispora saccharofermentans TaxID=3024236 RepID=A0ABT1NDC1_9FIRM|nr:sugar-binding domain-containing protein [Lutispora saccharofermentans]MCQ1528336.1 sugar-binding transcriptional regulator [Lutispora saccharofermentans]